MLTLIDGFAGKASYYVAKMRSPAWVKDWDGYRVIYSGIPSDTFNCVVSRDLEGPAAMNAIAEICSKFNDTGLPAAWWTCDELRAEAVPGELAKHHFLEDETDLGMLAELSSVPELVEPEGFEVRQVRSRDEVLAFGELLSSLSDPPDSSTRAYYRAVSELGEPDDGAMRLFLGLADGRPACTASLFLDGETGHVFDVCTLPEYRGCRFGTAMMGSVLRHARDAGARRGGLEASEEALGVYRRMGFEAVCTFRVYSNQRYIGETRPG